MRNCFLIFALVCFLSQAAWAITPWQAAAVSKAVVAEAWEESEKLFRELKNLELPDLQKLKVDYNLGLSLLQQEKFEEAITFLENSAKSELDESLQAKALYNKGNAHFRMDNLEEAKKAYQEALLKNPDDDDARYNLEVILKKEQENEQNQNQDQNQQDQENKQDEQDKDSDKKDQDKKDDDKQEDDSKNQEQDPKEGDKNQQDMTPEERQKVQEEAEKKRLLDYFKQQEKDARPDNRVPAQAPPVNGKTW